MDRLQETHLLYSSWWKIRTPEANGSRASVQSSYSESSADSRQAAAAAGGGGEEGGGGGGEEGGGGAGGGGEGGGGGGGVLQELFESARLNQQRQQQQQQTAPGVQTDLHVPPIVITSPPDSPSKAKLEMATGVPDPYSLLASGGITVQEFEQQQHQPHIFREEETAKHPQQGESTAEPQEEVKGESGPSDAQFVPIQEPPELPEQSSYPSKESADNPTVKLMTPSDFEGQTSVLSRLKIETGWLKEVVRHPDMLMTPQDFASPPRIARSASTPQLYEASLSMSLDIQPLTPPQFQQALIHMIRTDQEFVNRLHEAYLNSFIAIKRRSSRRR